MKAVYGSGISYRYDTGETPALLEISLDIERGAFIAILGQNSCGKSTLAKHLNALLPLQEGNLTVAELDVSKEENIWELRRLCGMVFQNPDDQFVSTIIEEDITFGLENHDFPEEEIPARVQDVLALVDMAEYAQRAPHALSGGQKQRIALAGVLATEPDILIFDEATSMLDPKGQKELLSYIKKLHGMGKTILLITHNVDEAIGADKILLMQGGGILAFGTPREILTDAALLQKTGLVPPISVQLYLHLAENGIQLPNCPLTSEELILALDALKGGDLL